MTFPTKIGNVKIDGKPRCWYCGIEMGENAIFKDKEKWKISGKWAFHFFSTHGIPPELTPTIMEDMKETLKPLLKFIDKK